MRGDEICKVVRFKILFTALARRHAMRADRCLEATFYEQREMRSRGMSLVMIETRVGTIFATCDSMMAPGL